MFSARAKYTFRAFCYGFLCGAFVVSSRQLHLFALPAGKCSCPAGRNCPDPRNCRVPPAVHDPGTFDKPGCSCEVCEWLRLTD